MTTPTPSKNKHLPTPITEQYIGRQLQDRPEWVDAELCRDFERELSAAQERAQAAEARVEECERIITAMTQWLEKQQPDVFRRGLWDAIAEGKK